MTMIGNHPSVLQIGQHLLGHGPVLYWHDGPMFVVNEVAGVIHLVMLIGYGSPEQTCQLHVVPVDRAELDAMTRNELPVRDVMHKDSFLVTAHDDAVWTILHVRPIARDDIDDSMLSKPGVFLAPSQECQAKS